MSSVLEHRLRVLAQRQRRHLRPEPARRTDQRRQGALWLAIGLALLTTGIVGVHGVVLAAPDFWAVDSGLSLPRLAAILPAALIGAGVVVARRGLAGLLGRDAEA